MKPNTLLFFAVLSLLAGCASSGAAPLADGASPAGLPPCPGSPNCVSSLSDEPARGIAPLPVPPGPDPMRRLAQAVEAEPRCRVVFRADGLLRAECASAVFGFVDDLEFRLDPAARRIQVRSAARSGWWDFGVNRRRVERIRAALASGA